MTKNKSVKKKALKRDTVIAVFFLLITVSGLVCLLYPTASDVVNTVNETKAIYTYSKDVTILPVKQYDEEYEKAKDYNERLYALDFPLYESDKIDGYEDTLNVSKNGVIGVIDIPQIDIKLPIYHGTDDEVLGNAVGHLKGSSFPLNEKNTHAVIAAHRGVTSARLFTDIDQLKLGDEFKITVLDNVLTYEVDSIQVVLPEETTALEIVDGENLVTLQTCTPYGINSHRLLVRGKCIKAEKLKSTETKQNTFEETVTTVMSVLMNKRNITPVIAAGAILLVFVILRITINIHRNSRRKKAMLNTILEVNEVKNNNAETV